MNGTINRLVGLFIRKPSNRSERLIPLPILQQMTDAELDKYAQGAKLGEGIVAQVAFEKLRRSKGLNRR